MIDRITCCFQCPDRFPGCHGKCEKYIQQKADFEKTKEETRKKRDIEHGLNASIYECIQKTAKKNHIRRGRSG